MNLENAWFSLAETAGELGTEVGDSVVPWSLAGVYNGGQSLTKKYHMRGGRNVTQEEAQAQASSQILVYLS